MYKLYPAGKHFVTYYEHRISSPQRNALIQNFGANQPRLRWWQKGKDEVMETIPCGSGDEAPMEANAGLLLDKFKTQLSTGTTGELAAMGLL